MRATACLLLILVPVALGGRADAQQVLRDVISTGVSPANSCAELDKRRAAFYNTTRKSQTAQETLQSCTKSGCLPSKLAALSDNLDSAKDANRLAEARLELLLTRFIQVRAVMGTNQSPMVDFVLGRKYRFTDPIDKAYDSIASPFPTSIVSNFLGGDKKFAKVMTRPVLDGQNVKLSIIPETFNDYGFPDYSFAYSLVGPVDAICDVTKSNGGVVFSLADHVDKSREMPVPLSLIFDVSTRRSTTKYSLYLSRIITSILEQLLYMSPPTDDALSKYQDSVCPRDYDELSFTELSLTEMMIAIGRLRQRISASLDKGEFWPTPDVLYKESAILPVRLAYRGSDRAVGFDNLDLSDRWTGGVIVKIRHHEDIGDLVLVRGGGTSQSGELNIWIVGIRSEAGKRLYGCGEDKVLWSK